MSLLYLVCQAHFPVHHVTPTVQTIAPSLCFLVIQFLTCCKNDCASSVAFSVVVPVVELGVVCFPSKTSRTINNSRKNQVGAAAQTTECASLVRDSWKTDYPCISNGSSLLPYSVIGYLYCTRDIIMGRRRITCIEMKGRNMASEKWEVPPF